MNALNHLWGCLGLLLLGGLLLVAGPVKAGQESQAQPPVSRHVRVSVQLVQDLTEYGPLGLLRRVGAGETP